MKISEIDTVIRRCARYVTSKQKFDSISSDICNDLEWLFCNNRTKYETAIFAFKAAFSPANSVFFNYVDFSHENTRATRNQPYFEPLHRTHSNWGKKSFKYRAVENWLQLPREVFTSTSGAFSLNIFKSNLKTHLLSQQRKKHEREEVCKLLCDEAIEAVVRRANDPIHNQTN